MKLATIVFSAVVLAVTGCTKTDMVGVDSGPRMADASDGTMSDAGAADADAPDADGLDAGGTRVDIAFRSAAPTRSTGGVEGGREFSLNCDVGKVVTGFQAYADSEQLWGMQLRCGELRVMRFAALDYEVGTGGASEGTLVGSATGTMSRSECGPSLFGRGIYGKSTEQQVFSLGLLCGTGWVNGSRDIEVNVEANSDFFGGGTGTSYQIACPANTILTGISGRADDTPGGIGIGIIRLSATCAPAIVTE